MIAMNDHHYHHYYLTGRMADSLRYKKEYEPAFYKWVCRLVLTAAPTYWQVIRHADLFHDKAMLVQIVRRNGRAIQYIPEEQRTSQLVMLAMHTFPDAVRHAPDNMRAKIASLADTFSRSAELVVSMHDCEFQRKFEMQV